jgi:hypothetical protein
VLVNTLLVPLQLPRSVKGHVAICRVLDEVTDERSLLLMDILSVAQESVWTCKSPAALLERTHQHLRPGMRPYVVP